VLQGRQWLKHEDHEEPEEPEEPEEHEEYDEHDGYRKKGKVLKKLFNVCIFAAPLGLSALHWCSCLPATQSAGPQRDCLW
jgi:hypothetical protein